MLRQKFCQLAPGILLCIVVSVVGAILEKFEVLMFGRAWLEAIALTIVLGAFARLVWAPGTRWSAGTNFSAKTLLEVAVVLLGASVNGQTVMAVGPALLSGIVIVVLVAIASSYGLGRLLGLRSQMATLVACGNAICGNSAIVAVAPVIGARREDISAAIAFTAVLAVVVVLGFQWIPALLHLSASQTGMLAGLTMYAVPQVLAAAAPLGSVAVQMGTVVKLVRVLMLGPVILSLSLLTRHRLEEPTRQLPLHRLVPWYVVGFLALVGLRSAHLVPHVTLAPIAVATNLLTIVSMAALGLGTDLRTVVHAGGRVTTAVLLSLLVLGIASVCLLWVAGIA